IVPLDGDRIDMTIISARVTQVLDRGIHLEADGRPGFINVTELTCNQRGGHRPEQFAAVGDIIDVWVYGESDHGFVASLSRLHPEDDRWRDPEQVAVGSRHQGLTYKIVSFGAFVELGCGIVGLVGDIPSPLAEGDVVQVEVTACEVRGNV